MKLLPPALQAEGSISPDYIAGANPTSAVYAAPMLDLAHVHVYTWDARPYPAFPNNTEVWGDGGSWRLGHWITGRLSSAPLDATVSTLLADYGFADHDTGALAGTLSGFVIDRVLPAREALQPLELAFFIDSRESDGRIVFTHRGAQPSAAEVTPDDLVERRPGDALSTLTRAQETDLPASAKLTFIAASGDYAPAVEEARRLAGKSGRIAVADLPLVLETDQAARIAETWLFEAWASRERAAFALPPSRLALEPGDLVSLEAGGRSRLLRITDIGEHGSRDIEARGIDPEVYGGVVPSVRPPPGAGTDIILGQPLVLFLDLPLLRGDEPPHAGYVAAAQVPWPGAVAFYRSPESSGFVLKAVANAPAVAGSLLDPLPWGVLARYDRAAKVRVKLERGALASVTPLALLAGANLAAIENEDGGWEVLQFEFAVLTEPATYELSVLLRGQAGTEDAMRAPLAAGARFVLLDAALARVDMGQDEVGLDYTWSCGPASRPLGDPAYLETHHTFTGRGLKPLSPVHVRGLRSGGDLTLALGAAHAHRRRQLGDDGGPAGRGYRALRDRYSRRRRRQAHDLLQHPRRHLHRRRPDRRLRRPAILRLPACLSDERRPRPRHPPRRNAVRGQRARTSPPPRGGRTARHELAPLTCTTLSARSRQGANSFGAPGGGVLPLVLRASPGAPPIYRP